MGFKPAKTALVAGIAAFLSVAPLARAEGATDWPAAKQALAALVKSLKTGGDCAEIWSIVWPWAKAGEPEARAILAASLFVYGLRPPGEADALALMRHNLVLTAYGALGATPVTKDQPSKRGDAPTVVMGHLFGLLQSKIVSDLGGDALKACLDGGKAPGMCVEEAVAQGFLPAFADYAADVDALAAAAVKPARCAAALRPGKGAVAK